MRLGEPGVAGRSASFTYIWVRSVGLVAGASPCSRHCLALRLAPLECSHVASELVTNPRLLAAAMQSAPANWEERNLQIVIHVRVIADTPAAQDVVARYFWPSP
ncbi:MAG: hypothetical protein ACRD2H_06210 [Terriglobales bacterium]